VQDLSRRKKTERQKRKGEKEKSRDSRDSLAYVDEHYVRQTCSSRTSLSRDDSDDEEAAVSFSTLPWRCYRFHPTMKIPKDIRPRLKDCLECLRTRVCVCTAARRRGCEKDEFPRVISTRLIFPECPLNIFRTYLNTSGFDEPVTSKTRGEDIEGRKRKFIFRSENNFSLSSRVI